MSFPDERYAPNTVFAPTTLGSWSPPNAAWLQGLRNVLLVIARQHGRPAVGMRVSRPVYNDMVYGNDSATAHVFHDSRRDSVFGVPFELDDWLSEGYTVNCPDNTVQCFTYAHERRQTDPVREQLEQGGSQRGESDTASVGSKPVYCQLRRRRKIAH